MILSRFGDIKTVVVEKGEHLVIRAKTLAGAIKLQERLQHYKGELRGFVLRTRDRGVELWVNRQELINNFYAAMEQLQAFAQHTKESACEHITAKKEQASQFYQQILEKIKEKEVQITTHWAAGVRATPTLPASEVVGEVIPAEMKQMVSAQPEPEAE